MAELSREGHRKRVKDAYLQNGFDAAADHNVLELILFYAIPRKDVKELAYAILNHFGGDLNAVFRAEVNELMRVNGVGENTAILLSTYGKVTERLNVQKNRKIKAFHSYPEQKEYVSNLLQGLPTERIMMITLDNAGHIIRTHTLSEGGVNRADVSARTIVTKAVEDKASAVLLAHNHPHGDFLPSESDATFTSRCCKLLRAIDVQLLDHIIVGEEGALSLANDMRYVYMFD